MSTTYNSKAPQLANDRDLGSYEQIIHSWGYNGSISKIVEQDGRIWFWCDGVQGSCSNEINKALSHENIVKSWGFEGVTSPITEGGGILSFMYEGELHSCPAQLQDTHAGNIDTARQLDLSMTVVPDQVAMVLSF